jgi:REP element-mobilizing transposase RayT
MRSSDMRSEIHIDEYIIMPNHLHGIVCIVSGEGSRPIPSSSSCVRATGRSPIHLPRGPAPRSLSSFVAGFKSAATTRINQHRGTPGARVWKRGYYDHIIRDPRDLDRIRRYIRQNPLKWALDRYHVDL